MDGLDLHVDKLHEDAHSMGAQVATENRSQDLPRLFPAFSRVVFPLRFLVSSFTTVHTVHTVHIACIPFTLVVNPLLTTIAHHIFSSVLAEVHYCC